MRIERTREQFILTRIEKGLVEVAKIELDFKKNLIHHALQMLLGPETLHQVLSIQNLICRPR